MVLRDVVLRAPIGPLGGPIRGLWDHNPQDHIYDSPMIADTHGSVFDRLFPVLAVDDAQISSMTSMHQTVAKLLQWSSEALESGYWPLNGMLDEDFDQTSLRHRRRRELLADGWRAVFVRMLLLIPNPLQP